MCQRKKYQSKEWQMRDDAEPIGKRQADEIASFLDNKSEILYDWEDIEDYLVLADVNSLYPTAQKLFEYAYGDWKYKTPRNDQEAVEWAAKLNRLEDRKDLMRRTCYEVSITPPRDLITAFLMRRDEKTKGIVHSLEPIEKQWYWGQELEEAIILKYIVDKVHCMKIFEKKGKIFDAYVDKCWQGRLDNPKWKNPLVNTGFKNALNELTGKFGQHTHQTNTCILSSNFVPESEKAKQALERLIANVVDHNAVFNRKGNNVAIELEVRNEQSEPSYPIYLSAQILAHARV